MTVALLIKANVTSKNENVKPQSRLQSIQTCEIANDLWDGSIELVSMKITVLKGQYAIIITQGKFSPLGS